MKRSLLVCLAALAAAAVAVPAASARAFTVRAGGVVIDNPYGGTATLGTFQVNLKAGPTAKVTYVDRSSGTYFHSLSLTKLMFTRQAVKIIGIGMVDGRRVQFTAIATDHPTAVDAFKIAWSHQAAHGGNLVSGNVHVRQLALY